MKKISESKKLKKALILTVTFIVLFAVAIVPALADNSGNQSDGGDVGAAGYPSGGDGLPAPLAAPVPNVLDPLLDPNTDITADFVCPVFRARVRHILGISEDDPILLSDVTGAAFYDVYFVGVTSIAGIEHFPLLESLSISSSNLASADFSYNTALHGLTVFGSQLTSLNLSNNTALTSLHVSYNQLTSLNLSNNTALTSLSVSDNQLTSLDLSYNTALTTLNVTGNQLTSLDLTNNTALWFLRAGFNQLTSLDLTNNPLLSFLHVNRNYMASMAAIIGLENTNVNIENTAGAYPGFLFYPQNVPADSDEPPAPAPEATPPTNVTDSELAVIRDGAGTADFTLPSGRVITISNIGTNLPATINLNVEVYSRADASTAYGAQIPANSIVIDPAATGNFGFTMSITISAAELEARNLNASTVNLFHVSTAGAVTDRTEQLVRNAEDNSVTVSFNSASVFVLSATTPTSAVIPPNDWYVTAPYVAAVAAPVAHNVPQTGITGRMILPLVLGIAGFALIAGVIGHRIYVSKKERT